LGILLLLILGVGLWVLLSQSTSSAATPTAKSSYSPQPTTFRTHVAGFPHRKGNQARPSHFFRQNDSLTPLRDPKNPHDQNAIKLLKNGDFLGFVAKADNPSIAEAMDKGHQITVRVMAVDDNDPWKGVKILITVARKQ
jgi:hypothetical protein